MTCFPGRVTFEPRVQVKTYNANEKEMRKREKKKLIKMVLFEPQSQMSTMNEKALPFTTQLLFVTGGWMKGENRSIEIC